MRNQIRFGTLVVLAAVYVPVAWIVLQSAAWWLCIYVLVTLVVGATLVGADVAQADASTKEFRKYRPLRSLGSAVAEFQHIFSHEEHLLPRIVNSANRRLVQEAAWGRLEEREFTDNDPNLPAPDGRSYYVAPDADTLRATRTFVAVQITRRGTVQSMQWWILARGLVDTNKRALLVASSPLMVPLWLVLKWRQQLDLDSAVRTVCDAEFNVIDVTTAVLAAHHILLDTLVWVLDDSGVDTSDLKQQRSQVMNINVAGGRAFFGNIVQGLGRASVTQRRTK